MFPVARAVLLSMREREDFVCVLKIVCGWASKTWLLPYACCSLHFIDSAACVTVLFYLTTAPLHLKTLDFSFKNPVLQRPNRRAHTQTCTHTHTHTRIIKTCNLHVYSPPPLNLCGVIISCISNLIIFAKLMLHSFKSWSHCHWGPIFKEKIVLHNWNCWTFCNQT